MIIARSPLRITLGGGGTDLASYYRQYGGHLIAAAIDKYVYVTIMRPFMEGVFLKYSQLEHVQTVAHVEHPIIREALDLVGFRTPQVEITTLADIPTQLYLNGGAYYNGNIYTFGNGYYGNGAIFRYVISSNSWSQLSVTVTGNRYYCQAATHNDKIYVTGGYYGGYSNLNDEFDPSTNSCTARATMPGGAGYHSQSTVDALGKIYVVGGYNNAYLAICYEYTPPSQGSAGGSWATKTPITIGGTQYPRGLMPANFSINNRVYIAGGYNNGQTQTCLEYNPNTDTWAARANMSNARYYTAGCAIGGKGYVYGGPPAYTSCEEFTPPAFGRPPNEPTNLGQSGSRAETALQSLADTTQFNGWTNNQINFSADVTDPDAAQQVRFRVQIKPQSAQWTQANQVTSLQTPLGSQGTKTLSWTIPADGGYDWRWRVEDAYSNSYPLPVNTWIEAFGSLAAPNTNSPDFRSDQVPPSDPIATDPHDVDFQVPDPYIGDVVLHWIESTDNGPTAGISYELQVAFDGGFLGIEAQLFSTAGTSEYPIALSVSRYEKYWRIRARDVGGNFSGWSAPRKFRVTYNDGIDHSAGDAEKNCGMTASAVPALGSALLGLAVIALAALRRKLA